MEDEVKLFLVWLAVFAATYPIFSFGQTTNQLSDKIVCERMSASIGVQLQPNTNKKVRWIIKGIAPASTPSRLVVCSGEDPGIASAERLENFYGIYERGWIITFDNDFFAKAPYEIFRATMAHEVSHLVLNNACQVSNSTLRLQCEYETDVLAETLVGKCSTARSLKWLLAYGKERWGVSSADDLRILLNRIDPQDKCR